MTQIEFSEIFLNLSRTALPDIRSTCWLAPWACFFRVAGRTCQVEPWTAIFKDQLCRQPSSPAGSPCWLCTWCSYGCAMISRFTMKFWPAVMMMVWLLWRCLAAKLRQISVVKVFQTFLLLALKLWFHGCLKGATVDVKIQFPMETVPEHLRTHNAWRCWWICLIMSWALMTPQDRRQQTCWTRCQIFHRIRRALHVQQMSPVKQRRRGSPPQHMLPWFLCREAWPWGLEDVLDLTWMRLLRTTVGAARFHFWFWPCGRCCLQHIHGGCWAAHFFVQCQCHLLRQLNLQLDRWSHMIPTRWKGCWHGHMPVYWVGLQGQIKTTTMEESERILNRRTGFRNVLQTFYMPVQLSVRAFKLLSQVRTSWTRKMVLQPMAMGWWNVNC